MPRMRAGLLPPYLPCSQAGMPAPRPALQQCPTQRAPLPVRGPHHKRQRLLCPAELMGNGRAPSDNLRASQARASGAAAPMCTSRARPSSRRRGCRVRLAVAACLLPRYP